MVRDPTSSAIWQPRGLLLGTLWVSGLLTGFRQFLDDERIGLVINCLNSGQDEIIGMSSNDGRYMDSVEIALPRVAFALARGKHILAHCAHGVHRSRSFVILFSALIVRHRFLGEASPGWNFLSEQSWSYWLAKRALASRGTRRRDLAQESWVALYEYFGGSTVERLEGLALRAAQEIQRAFPTLAEADTLHDGHH